MTLLSPSPASQTPQDQARQAQTHTHPARIRGSTKSRRRRRPELWLMLLSSSAAASSITTPTTPTTTTTIPPTTPAFVPPAWHHQPTHRQRHPNHHHHPPSGTSCLATATGGWDSSSSSASSSSSSSSTSRRRHRTPWETALNGGDGEDILLRATTTSSTTTTTTTTTASPPSLLTSNNDEDDDDDASWQNRMNAAEGGRARGRGESISTGPLRRNYRFDITVKKPMGIYMGEGVKGAPTVTKIVPGGNAEKAGLKVGDRIMAASATIGKKLWTKTTLVGVESAINSRFRFSDDITFSIERSLSRWDAANDDDRISSREVEVFEVELERPVPLEFIQEDMEGGVFVRRILRADTPALQQIQPFDRVVAVSASLGDRLWRTNSLEGVLSALNTRIGAKVRLQFERSPEVTRMVARSIGNVGGVGVRGGIGAAAMSTGGSTTSTTTSSSTTTTRDREADIQRDATSCSSSSSSSSSLPYSPPTTTTTTTTSSPTRTTPRPATTTGTTAKDEAASVFLIGEQRAQSVLSQMSAALRDRDADRAISVYKLAVERGITPDSHCASSLIKAYGMKKQADKALEVVRMMLDLGVQPDLVTYNALMDACEKGNKPQEALRVFRTELPARGLEPDIYTYTVLVNMHGKRGELKEALALFEEACAKGLRPELPAYTAVIKAVVKKDDMSTALALLRRVFDDGLSPDTRLYNTLIWGHTKRLEWGKAMQILRLMEAKQVYPDHLTYSYLLSSLVDSDQAPLAQDLYREMLEKGHVRPNLQLYSLAIDMYAKTGDTTQAVAVFKEMRRNKIMPNLVTYTSLMEAFVRAGYPMAALSISDEMHRKTGMPRDVTSYVWRLKCFVELGDLPAIEALLQEMHAQPHLTINVVVFNQYLRACVRLRDYARALEVLSVIFTKYIPNDETHSCLLELPVAALDSPPPTAGGETKNTQTQTQTVEDVKAAVVAGEDPSSLLSSSSSTDTDTHPHTHEQAQEATAALEISHKEDLVLFYHAVLKLMSETKTRARVSFYVAFLHACLRTDRLDLAAEILALRQANTLQIFQLFKKHLPTVERWEGKLSRELDKRFYRNKNLV